MSVYRKVGQVELTKTEVLTMLANEFKKSVPGGEVVSVVPADIRLDIKPDGRMIILHDPKWST